LDPEERVETFLSRLRVLKTGTRPRALRRMLRMIAQTREYMPPPVWQAAAEAFLALEDYGPEEVETLSFLFSKRSDSGVTEFATSLLSSEKIGRDTPLENLLVNRLAA